MTTNKAVIILSGGMDSSTLAYLLAHQGYHLHAISFDYGQRHKKELESASAIAHALHAEHTLIDLRKIGSHLTGSALTDETVEVPHGYYAAENMRLTVVPNRNAIMLSIATGIAVAEGAEMVATAVHAGDHYIYPDCRPEFIAAFEKAMQLANMIPTFQIHAPFIDITKVEIARIGAALGVPYELTWTCYEGGDIHCGVCGSCQERRAGFRESGVPDPTIYRDLTVYDHV